MKRLTLSADEDLLERAREVARAQKRTLGDAFREWLAQFTQRPGRADEYEVLVKRLRRTTRSSGPYTLDEMNKR